MADAARMASVTPRRNAWDESASEVLQSDDASIRDDIIDPELENEFGRLEGSEAAQIPSAVGEMRHAVVARPNCWRERE